MMTRSVRRALRLAAAAVAVPFALHAQTGAAHQVELGAFGTYTHFDPTATNLAGRSGAGGRLGYYFSRLISVEADGDYTVTRFNPAGADVSVSRIGGSMLFHARAMGLYLGAGYERLFYRGAATTENDGGHLVLGSLMSLGGRAGFRVEGRISYLPGGALPVTSETKRPLNFGLNFGLSVFAFGGPPRDSDHDGVPNSADRCPNTPRGALVDKTGCPLDSDHDGVYDGLDKCPNTPVGAKVDAAGCPIDSDKDGVPDGIDQCADTPAGATVDAKGCPIDSDHDGVYDGLDKCPDTPVGAKVDANGCPIDSDHDGVPDGIDQCPDTPPGTAVDAKGCAVVVDSDHDGVPDNLDRCPNTAPGTKVDAVGCPVIQQTVQAAPRPLFQIVAGKAQPLILKGVTFQTGSARLTPSSHRVLDQVAASLLANPSVKIEIGGHTDSTGPRALNLRLSLARALSVRTYLVSKGVSPDRLAAKGYGPDRPIASNRTPEGRAMNRRVELTLISGQP